MTEHLRRAHTHGWVPILALAAVQGVDNGERVALSQAVAGLKDAFAVSDATVGLIPTAMVVSGVLGTFALGWLADRVRRTTLMAVMVTLWSAFLLVSGATTTFALLVGLHVGVGLLQAADPAAMSLIGDYEAVEHRARAMGVWQFGSFVGAMVGTLGAGIAVALGGWRWAFWMWPPLGALTAVALLRLPEPVRGEQDAALAARAAADTAAGRITSAGGITSAADPPPRPARHGDGALSELLAAPTFWVALVAISLAQMLFIGLSFWGIEYLKRAFSVSPVVAGAGAAALGVGAGAGVLLGGTWADRRLARGVTTARVQVAAVGSLVSGLVLALAFAAPTLVLAIPLLALGGLALTIPLAPSETILIDVVPPYLRGRAGAVRTAARGLSGLSPALIGLLSDAVGLRGALVLSSPVLVVAGLLLLPALRTYSRDMARAIGSVAPATRSARVGPASQPRNEGG